MEISRVCTTNQNYLISFLKQRSDLKIPDMPNEITVRINNDIRTKNDPSLKEYLLNKGKSEDDVAAYLDINLTKEVM